MSRLFYHVMQDNSGNLLFGVTGTMRLAGTGTLATIYGDPALATPIANPMTNHVSFGSFRCYLGPGSYDFYMAKAGYTFETLTGLPGLGTMADQNASAVSITGTCGVSGILTGYGGITTDHLGISTAPSVYPIDMHWLKASAHGVFMKPLDADTPSANLAFANLAGTLVGNITTNATTTTYNTSSDSRLKHDVETLTGELDILQALRPVRYLWNADNTPGVGFLAHEVAAHVQGVITGNEGAVDEAGGIVPQMIDYSKLVPYLVGAIKTLTARLAVLEDALGV